jgi:hypothetical protein
MDWSRFSSLFDIHGEYPGKPLDESLTRKGKRVVNGRIIRNPSLSFLFVDFYKIHGRASGLSTMRETLVPHVLVIPPPSSSSGRVYDGSFSSIAISTNPPGKSTRMTWNWPQRVVQRANQRHLEMHGGSGGLVEQGATRCGCRVVILGGDRGFRRSGSDRARNSIGTRARCTRLRKACGGSSSQEGIVADPGREL